MDGNDCDSVTGVDREFCNCCSADAAGPEVDAEGPDVGAGVLDEAVVTGTCGLADVGVGAAPAVVAEGRCSCVAGAGLGVAVVLAAAIDGVEVAGVDA